jgi:hypothetical protein
MASTPIPGRRRRRRRRPGRGARGPWRQEGVGEGAAGARRVSGRGRRRSGARRVGSRVASSHSQGGSPDLVGPRGARRPGTGRRGRVRWSRGRGVPGAVRPLRVDAGRGLEEGCDGSGSKGREADREQPGAEGGEERVGIVAVRMKVVAGGGSSRILRRALAASSLASCGTRSSASPMMKTCRGHGRPGGSEAPDGPDLGQVQPDGSSSGGIGDGVFPPLGQRLEARRLQGIGQLLRAGRPLGRGRGKNQWMSGCWRSRARRQAVAVAAWPAGPAPGRPGAGRASGPGSGGPRRPGRGSGGSRAGPPCGRRRPGRAGRPRGRRPRSRLGCSHGSGSTGVGVWPGRGVDLEVEVGPFLRTASHRAEDSPAATSCPSRTGSRPGRDRGSSTRRRGSARRPGRTLPWDGPRTTVPAPTACTGGAGLGADADAVAPQHHPPGRRSGPNRYRSWPWTGQRS